MRTRTALARQQRTKLLSSQSPRSVGATSLAAEAYAILAAVSSPARRQSLIEVVVPARSPRCGRCSMSPAARCKGAGDDKHDERDQGPLRTRDPNQSPMRLLAFAGAGEEFRHN